MDAIARMDRRCDELGVDTMEMGCTIGVSEEEMKVFREYFSWALFEVVFHFFRAERVLTE